MVVVNGRSIRHYEPVGAESGLAVVEAEPRYKRAISNGYVPEDIILNGLVLYLPLYALKGSSFKSVDRYEHSCSVTGALWTPQGRTFDGSDDQIAIANHSALDFTSEAFTILLWIEPTFTEPSYEALFFKGDAGVEGYALSIHANKGVFFRTYQLGAAQDSYYNAGADLLVADTWVLLGITRSGTSATWYKDGVAKTWSTADSHTDPATSSEDAIIGENNDGAADYGGKVGEVMVYSKALSAEEITHTYNATKWRYQ